MKQLPVLILLLSSMCSYCTDKITVINKTGEPITILSTIENRVLLTEYDSLKSQNRLQKPLQTGESIAIRTDGKEYNMHVFCESNPDRSKTYFVPFGMMRKGKVVIDTTFFESTFDGNSVVSMMDPEWPRIYIKIINKTDIPLVAVYYRADSGVYKNFNLIASYKPIRHNETRDIYFFPELKKNRDESGTIINYIGFIDLKILGLTKSGELKTFEVKHFDCVKNEDVLLQ
jgi:hypothetical protein